MANNVNDKKYYFAILLDIFLAFDKECYRIIKDQKNSIIIILFSYVILYYYNIIILYIKSYFTDNFIND